MSHILKPLGLAALVAFAAPAFAQDTATDDAPAAEAAAPEAPAAAEPQLGEEVGIEEYVDEVFDDWERSCLRIPGNEGATPCQITQLLYDESGDNPVGKISVGKLPEAMQADAGAAVIVPLGVSLQENVLLAVDSGTPKKYSYTSCEPIGCMAQFGFTAAEIASLKAGNAATITVAPANSPKSAIKINVSLAGFTAAFDSLETPPGAPAQ